MLELRQHDRKTGQNKTILNKFNSDKMINNNYNKETLRDYIND